MIKFIKRVWKNVFHPTPHIATAMQIKFHKEANLFGEHGTLVVSHVGQKLVEQPVRFVFPGIATPPAFDLTLMIKIWTSAEEQGYIPHSLRSYGKENNMVISKPDMSNVNGTVNEVQ